MVLLVIIRGIGEVVRDVVGVVTILVIVDVGVVIVESVKQWRRCYCWRGGRMYKNCMTAAVHSIGVDGEGVDVVDSSGDF